MAAEDKAYLGTTVVYPFVVVGGSVTTITGEQAVKQSVLDILSTQIGEVFFNRGYGSDIKEQIFDPNDLVLAQMLELSAAKALKKWEKRITFVGSKAVISNAQISITVAYRIMGQNELASTAYTYYRNADGA